MSFREYILYNLQVPPMLLWILSFCIRISHVKVDVAFFMSNINNWHCTLFKFFSLRSRSSALLSIFFVCHSNFYLWSAVLKHILMECQNMFKFYFPACNSSDSWGGEIFSTSCWLQVSLSYCHFEQRAQNHTKPIYAKKILHIGLMMFFQLYVWWCVSFVYVSSGSFIFQHISQLHFTDIIAVFPGLINMQFNNV